MQMIMRELGQQLFFGKMSKEYSKIRQMPLAVLFQD